MMTKKLLSLILALALVFTFTVTTMAAAVDTASSAVTVDQSAVLTFSDNSITETSAGSGYTIDGTTLTITAAGTYRIGGSCTEGAIIVSKGLSNVTLILDDLTLASSTTAPIVVKKTATVNIHLEGTSTLTDNEDPANETSSDVTVAEAFEGAAIKVKSGSSVTFCGSGNLNVVANAKNGIKGGSTTSLIFNQSGTINVSGNSKYYGATTSGAAVNNGIGCDGSIVINQGTYIIKAANDGIKSAPDATDTTEGTTIDTDSAGTVTINGGTFDIDVDGDGIQADTELNINGGTFDIQTWKGYSVWNDTLADSYSCKGLKASGDRAEEAGIEPALNITGGTFTLNTGDDAVHSDAYATVTGGTFTIQTGDDGMHGDTSLTIGTENGYDRDPDITINHSYEGLEGGTVYMYSGRAYVVASDDGVNAAGGSSSGSDPGAGGGNTFNPGGGPGGHGPGGGFNPGGGGSATSGDYNIYIYGGDLYVNCSGDGLDSNGGLYLYGGTQAVFSMQAGGDNSAIDADGTVSIQGATVFTAGTAGMDGSAQSSWFGTNQKYSSSTTRYNSGTIINTKAGSNGSVVFSYALPRSVNYIMASWPSAVSSSTPAFATATSVTACKGESSTHSWNSGTENTAATSTSTGLMTYTCTKCGETEQQTIPMTVSVKACDHTVDQEAIADNGYTITFAGDSGVDSITVYQTQDYTGASESVSATGSAVSRSSATGEPDSTGDGQVNFTIVLKDGYALDSVSVTEGTYKNIKGPTDTGVANTYRITKVSADTTITIATVQCLHGTVASGTTPSWSWSDGYGTSTLSYTCADCSNTVNIDGIVTSALTSSSLITFTAKASIGSTEYTDTRTASPFTATFSCDEGVKAINVYYTQDYSSADETGVSSAIARDGDSGYPVVTGDGQVNFVVVLKDGYALSDVVASGAYKNLKAMGDKTYRITKVTGAVTINITTEKSETSSYILGDADGDEDVTIIDATYIQRALAGIELPYAINEKAADVDGDGDVTIIDVTCIQRYLAGIEVPYAIGEPVSA
ncbi:MAG: carbohydrate-binding domain-containing protein [Ruminococcus sp.]|uniref:carbohydrate-binding domain-containing protein n=1 Tax=Ruminococcus sp. TaxID=41978 RepID=UPI002873707E|nr:carbohydrate-binding domain-containing protein [Ruminococcus sp.]MBQ3285021.1 carbohydrate-binding domain-containing protein [Ruminococcus sp.]